MNLHVIVEITNTGYSAYIKELDIYTTGDNITRLTQNLHEGIALYYDPKPVTPHTPFAIYQRKKESLRKTRPKNIKRYSRNRKGTIVHPMEIVP